MLTRSLTRGNALTNQPAAATQLRNKSNNQTAALEGHARRQAFTLLEIVIVLAVTAVVFGLLLRPLISSLSLTQEAQSLAAAQDSGRNAMEGLSRELSHANFVFSGLSHPFSLGSNPTVAAGTNEDTYSDFLNIEVPAQSSVLASGNSYTLAHVYGAKLDFALANQNAGGTGTVTDPTSQQPVTMQTNASGSLSEQPAPAVLPLAASTMLVRYFVGLQHPVIKGVPGHYSNDNIGLSINGQSSNTYVLYRAQVSVFSGTQVNPNYFTTVADSNQELTTDPRYAKDSVTPEIDDPDFFRYVNAGDINWLDSGHAGYTAAQATLHNSRVDSWILAAKPVVSAPQIDLLDLPHNADGSIDYDVNGIPCLNYASDGVSGATKNPDLSGTQRIWPVANVTVSFSPTAFPSDSPAPTATENLAQGFTNSPFATGIPYIPNAYQASHASWSPNYSVSLYPYGYGTAGNVQQASYFYTRQTFQATASSTTDGVTHADAPGDMIEYRVDPTNAYPGIAVYNVTQGAPEPGATVDPNLLYNYYIPFTVDADRGYLNFSIAAVAPPFVNQNTPYTSGITWPATTGQYNSSNPNNPFYVFNPSTHGTLDLGTAQDKTPQYETVLAPWTTGNFTTSTAIQPLTINQIQNAMLVPGAVRVWGPDSQQGPNYACTTQYSSVGTSNLVNINYTLNELTFSSLPTAKATAPTDPDPIAVSFNYQANLTLDDPTLPPYPQTVSGTTVTPGNYAHPMTVSAAYASRDAINASIGIRVYRPGSQLSDLATYPATIAVGNANH